MQNVKMVSVCVCVWYAKLVFLACMSNEIKIGPWGPELIWYLATKNNKVQGTCDNWPWRNCSEAGRGGGWVGEEVVSGR